MGARPFWIGLSEYPQKMEENHFKLNITSLEYIKLTLKAD
jgi:hypothetical protein